MDMVGRQFDKPLLVIFAFNSTVILVVTTAIEDQNTDDTYKKNESPTSSNTGHNDDDSVTDAFIWCFTSGCEFWRGGGSCNKEVAGQEKPVYSRTNG